MDFKTKAKKFFLNYTESLNVLVVVLIGKIYIFYQIFQIIF
jgi:hypothetical protein